MGANWQTRENKQNKKRNRMPVHGRSVFTILEQKVKRSEEIKKGKVKNGS